MSAALNIISRVIAGLTCLLAGAALVLGFFRAYMLGALLAGGVCASALALREPIVTEAQKNRQRAPLSAFWPRLRTHIRDSFGFLKSNPRAACKILADAGIATPIYLSFMYLQEHLTENGLPPLWLGAVLLGVRLSGSLGVAVGAKGRLPLFSVAMLCALCAGIGTAMAGVSGLWWLSAAGAAVACFAEGMMQLRTDVSLNADIPSDQRATLVSVGSMVYSLLMIAASPLSGAVGEVLGTGWSLGLLGAALIAAALGLGALWRRLSPASSARRAEK